MAYEMHFCFIIRLCQILGQSQIGTVHATGTDKIACDNEIFLGIFRNDMILLWSFKDGLVLVARTLLALRVSLWSGPCLRCGLVCGADLACAAG